VALAPAPKPELAPVRPPPTASEEGLPWPLILGGGVAVLGVIIFLVSRKKS
jgi:LPXTG-motif cell wall-anchored protein